MTIRLSSIACVILLVSLIIDAIIAALCCKSEQFDESVPNGFHESDSSMYMLLDDLLSLSEQWQATKNSSETGKFVCDVV